MSPEAPGAGAMAQRSAMDALLRPRSVAIVGATDRAGAFGHDLLTNLSTSRSRPTLYPINPKYESIAGLPCYPSVSSLPETPDCAVLAVADARLEAALADAARAGAGAAVIFGSAVEVDAAGATPLPQRLGAIAREAGMAVCGANCMGFVNNLDDIVVGGWPLADMPRQGGVGLITHSGSSFSALLLNQRWLGFSCAVSSGQELVTTSADYLSYMVARASTRAVGCILEQIRDPDRFLDAVDQAEARDIPVVVLKLGRSAQGRALARAHSGALVGSDAAHRAVFARHNVLAVETLDELMDTLELLSCGRRPTRPGLGLATDSGGERTMIADLASDVGVYFAAIASPTVARLAAVLEPGLLPANPVDIWGTGREHERIAEETLHALADDPEVGMVVFAANMPSGRQLLHTWSAVAQRAHAATTKPVAMLGNLSSAIDRDEARRLRAQGVPVLMGTRNGLIAIRNLMAWQFRQRSAAAPTSPDPLLVASWRDRLASAREVGGDTALDLIAAFSLPVPAAYTVETEDEAGAGFARLGGPIVLKTLAPGLDHKSDRGGVVLGLADEAALRAAYRRVAQRFGPRALVQRHAEPGVELFFGAVEDPSFGPIISIGLGGIFVEVMKDVATLKPPFEAIEARRAIESLRGFPLLAGARGRPPCDVGAIVAALVAFGDMAVALRGAWSEIDVNPVISTASGVVAVDALVVRGAAGVAGSPG